jgi:hypothetical protein
VVLHATGQIVIEIEGQDDMTDTPDAQGGQSQPGSGQQPAAGATSPQSGSGQQPARTENPNTRGVSPARDQREAAARAAGQQPGAEQQSDQQRSESQPPAGGEKIKIGDVEISPDEFKKVMQFKGEQDARKLTLPKDANGYTLDLPADFKPPAGVKFEFNKNDPGLAQIRDVAFKRGWDQSTLSDALGVYAANKIAEGTRINGARAAEIAKLGSAAPQRIDAVKTFMHGTCGSDLGGAIEQMLCTAKQVEAFEKIINQFSRQGGTQFSQAHRESEPPRGTIPGYANMTFEQRRAAQMAQNPQAPRTYRAPGER